jgi:monoamine oxidase
MSRSPAFRALTRIARVSTAAERLGLSSLEAVQRAHASALFHPTRPVSRRDLLRGLAATAAVAPFASLVPTRAHAAPTRRTDLDVAIIGAGIAGLAAADALDAKGIRSTVFEASSRAGGRMFSYAGPEFLGQTVELGGELIDTTHTTIRAYANELGLTLEDYNKEPGEGTWYADGRLVHEHEVVDEYRVFVDAMRDDLRRIGSPTADSFTADDELFDWMDLRTYLQTRGAGPILTDALDAAYTGEYGRELHEQSALNLLLFIHADRRSQFAEFGVFSDERFHVVGGNGQIPEAIAARLSRPVEHGCALIAASRRSDGRYELTFDRGGSTLVHTADFVIFALPFTALRDVHLDPSLGLPSWKRQAIDEFGYAMNTKTMVSFAGRPWQANGSNGGAYALRPVVQNVWETSPHEATSTRGVLTDYAGGDRAVALAPAGLQADVGTWLNALEDVLPGVPAHARQIGGTWQSVRMHWPSVPTHRGSYAGNGPGYFTTIAGNEGKPVGNLLFAGEHADSFYEWQGYMEGAANTGLAAADVVIRAARRP